MNQRKWTPQKNKERKNQQTVTDTDLKKKKSRKKNEIVILNEESYEELSGNLKRNWEKNLSGQSPSLILNYPRTHSATYRRRRRGRRWWEGRGRRWGRRRRRGHIQMTPSSSTGVERHAHCDLFNLLISFSFSFCIFSFSFSGETLSWYCITVPRESRQRIPPENPARESRQRIPPENPTGESRQNPPGFFKESRW